MPLHLPTLASLHHHLLLQFPSIHDLRMLNMVSTICTCGFAITATALSIYSGKRAAAAEPCWWMRASRAQQREGPGNRPPRPNRFLNPCLEGSSIYICVPSSLPSFLKGSSIYLSFFLRNATLCRVQPPRGHPASQLQYRGQLLGKGIQCVPGPRHSSFCLR